MDLKKIPNITSLQRGQVYTIGIIAVVAIIVIVVLCIYWSKIKSWFIHKKENVELDSVINKSNLTISDAVLRQYANQLYKAMKGPGTDEDVIYDVFGKMNTDDDVLELIMIFGTKKDDTLPQWIQSELTTKERERLNNILTNKFIAYQF